MRWPKAKMGKDTMQPQYTNESCLGSGTIGKVYKVKTSTGLQVAMKVSYKPHRDLRGEAICLATIKKGSTINSRFVVRLLDVFPLGTQHAFTMELLRMTLTAAVEKGVLKDEQLRWNACRFLGGVAAIHTSKLAHRELKPQNVMPDDRLGVRVRDLSLSKGGVGCGTKSYMAPELFSAANHQRPSYTEGDAWPAGLVLYLMLEGKHPFFGVDLEQHQQQEAYQPNISFSSTPQPARELIISLLHFDLKKRASVRAVVNHDWLNGIPIFGEGKLDFRNFVGAGFPKEDETKCGASVASGYSSGSVVNAVDLLDKRATVHLTRKKGYKRQVNDAINQPKN